MTDVVQCRTCGVERHTAGLPELCPICADERQYPDPDGQRWVDPGAFDGRIALTEHEPGLWGLDVADGVGIGQQAKVTQRAIRESVARLAEKSKGSLEKMQLTGMAMARAIQPPVISFSPRVRGEAWALSLAICGFLV